MKKPDANRKSEYNSKEEQLEYLMRRFGDRVLHLAYSYLRDRDEAEDASQEVFLKVYQSLDRFRGESSPFTWIYKITVNLCRDRLRKRKVIKWDYQGDTLSYPSLNPEQQVIQSLEEQELYAAVLDLPVTYREMIILHYLNELSLKEIAAVTGMNISLVKVRLYRARKKLQEILEDRGIGYGSQGT